jgi:hypothetical protein
MSTDFDSTIDLLTTALFSPQNQTPCGPLGLLTQSVPTRIPQKSVRPLYNLIPDQTYRPEIYVAFDFLSAFPLEMDILDDTGTPDILSGQRLVSQDTFDNVVRQMLDFHRYYYDHILTYVANDTTQGYSNRSAYYEVLQSGDNANKLYYVNKIINYFLTSVTVNRVRNDISSCTLEFRDNAQYNIFGEQFHLFFRNKFPMNSQMFVPMIPFTVWAKGRIYTDFMFPIFTGYITRITPSNDQGYTAFKIDGRDALELARISMEATNPAFIQVNENQRQAMNFFSKPLYGIDHMQIIRAMFAGGVADTVNGKRIFRAPDGEEKPGMFKLSPIGDFRSADEEPGHTQPPIVWDYRYELTENFSIRKMITHLAAAKYIVAWGYNITPYREFMITNPDAYSTNFSNRLDLIKGVAGQVYHDFYTDGAGNVHYHPMRLSNDFLIFDSFYPKDAAVKNTTPSGQVSKHKHTFPFAQVISDEEITSINKTFNIEELTTFLMLEGVPRLENMGPAKVLDLVASVWDYPNARRFGYRRKDMICPMMNVPVYVKDKDGNDIKLIRAMAQAFMDFVNGELYTVTASLIFRPELELSLPLYYTNDNEVFYIQSITHTITIGSNAATVVNGSFGRLADEPPVDLLSYMLQTEACLHNDPDLSFVNTGDVDKLELNQKMSLNNFIEKKKKTKEDLESRYDTLSRKQIDET